MILAWASPFKAILICYTSKIGYILYEDQNGSAHMELPHTCIT